MSDNRSPVKATRKNSHWGWGVAVVYSLFALAMLGFVLYSTTQRVELVDARYYEKGLDHAALMEKSRITAVSGNTPMITCEPKTGELAVCFVNAVDPVITGTITLFRPSASALDTTIVISTDQHRCAALNGYRLRPGYWHLKIDWMQDGIACYVDKPIMVTP